MIAGVADRAGPPRPASPTWSSGPASIATSPRPSSERLAEWLAADYEPFGAHSHYGLVLGETSHLQVAETIRAFLEANRPVGAPGWYHSGRSGARRHRPTCRIRLEAQDTALSRRRSPVRIRYAVPATSVLGLADSSREGPVTDAPAARRLIILAEGQFGPHDGKTAMGVIRYGPDPIVAVIDSTNAGRNVGNGSTSGPASTSRSSPRWPTPWRSDPSRGAPTALLIGIAPTGGKLPAAWRRTILDAIGAGLDILSGLHTLHRRRPRVRRRGPARPASRSSTTAGRRPARRRPSAAAHGPGKHVILTVGTDCAIGKMSVALELRRAALRGRPGGGLRAHRPDRDDDRRLGRGGRSGDQRLLQRDLRVARRAGRGARATGSSSRARARSTIRPTAR